MVTPEEAVAVAGVGLRTIYRWVEEGRLHITETADGLFRICLNSLLR
jgi:excisionase family DNA binding protein